MPRRRSGIGYLWGFVIKIDPEFTFSPGPGLSCRFESGPPKLGREKRLFAGLSTTFLLGVLALHTQENKERAVTRESTLAYTTSYICSPRQGNIHPRREAPVSLR